jgi:cell division protein FtsL
MATAVTTLPRPRARRPRNQLVGTANRACFPDITYVKRIDNSRLRREVDWEKRRECYSLLGLGILVFLFGLLYAWQHFDCVRYGYQIEQLKSQQTTLEEWNHELQLTQASLTDPQRIDTMAQQRLGLQPAKPQQVIPLGPAPEAPPGRPEFADNLSRPAPLPGSVVGRVLSPKTQGR